MSCQRVVYTIVIEGGNKLIWISYTKFGEELTVLACYYKLLVALPLGVLIVVIFNVKVFVVSDKLVESGAA